MKAYIKNGKDNRIEGPFLIDELKGKKLSKDTLIWYQGLDNWIGISEDDKLNFLIKDEQQIPVMKKNSFETNQSHKDNIQYYFYKKDDKTYGPVELKMLLEKVSPETLVYADNLGKWIPAGLINTPNNNLHENKISENTISSTKNKVKMNIVEKIIGVFYTIFGLLMVLGVFNMINYGARNVIIYFQQGEYFLLSSAIVAFGISLFLGFYALKTIVTYHMKLTKMLKRKIYLPKDKLVNQNNVGLIIITFFLLFNVIKYLSVSGGLIFGGIFLPFIYYLISTRKYIIYYKKVFYKDALG